MNTLILALSGSAAAHQHPPLRMAGLRAVAGSGLLVAVGYIDPGNWATDIAGGSGFGYGLLAVVFAAALLGMGFQVLTARLALATGQDLATLTARHLPRPLARSAWLAGEAAILATALAELIGGAIALRLLLGLPLMAGVGVTALGTLAVFYAARRNADRHEQVIGVLLGVVAVAFVYLLVRAQPSAGDVASGIADTGNTLRDPEAFLIALGILGATLMPHNLYLHSGALAQRAAALSAADRPMAMRIARNDTMVSLGIAMLINAAIMVVAAASLSGSGPVVASLDGAHAAIGQTLGAAAAVVFGVALYAAGQSSTITGVMAGRVLSRGFQPAGSGWWERRRAVITRAVAGVAALALLAATGGRDPDGLLVLSQVILSLALPFALIPLVVLARRRDVMGRYVLRGGWAVAALAATTGIVLLDGYLLAQTLF
ncbi:Nramp family divalent metal transporter [Bordetella genomosp. 13]|uniref:Manganese transporter n=1 Tax=Bordetella genomosp. 13 TaxID=463040 RepID=A0A1W6ZBK2_9BORD|nr:Nramp family divalent metal transporter [Bordetella genomosp. 13]ARP94632.1 manganese transporter [Bordetella genomosp. 13]